MSKLKELAALMEKKEALEKRISELETEIIKDMKKNKIRVINEGKYTIRLKDYNRYTHWDIDMLKVILSGDFKKYVKEGDTYSVNVRKLKRSDKWKDVRKYARCSNIRYLEIVE